jgi:phosphoglycolate phosphatase
VLFDLDGTLLDTLTDLADAMNRALVKMGFPAHPVEAYKHFVGDGVENEAKRTLPKENLDPETIAKCVELSRAEYHLCWQENTRPYPGIRGLLDELSGRGMPMAVLSNKPDDFTKIMIAKILPDWRFEAVQGALSDVPVKPDPTGALRIARELRIRPDEILYLGDTNTDMKTAVNAGMYPVGCLWGFRSADELTKNGAKFLASRPADVLKILDTDSSC